MNERTRGRWAFGLTSASVAWAVALVPAAFLVPVYSTESVDWVPGPDGGRVGSLHRGATTLIAVNGVSVRLLIFVALPTALAAIAWAGLHRTCTRGRISGRRVATVASLAFAILVVITGLSIGVAMVPALALLVAGHQLTPKGPAGPAS